jgi:HAD superfamily phosphatase
MIGIYLGFGNWSLMIMDLLIFDMDGVLIDVTKSYRKTIQRTIQIYLETCLGLQRKRGDWITNEEISLFKSAGGFNNDWELTYGILLYLISLSNLPLPSKRKRFSSVKEIIPYLKAKSLRSHGRIVFRRKRKHLLAFLEKVKSAGRGLKGIRRISGGSREGWVYGTGDLDQENLVKRVFQEIYLGATFSAHYHLPRLFHRGKGFYLKERVLISKKILAFLRKKVRMGIASGRPRFEAELALKRFHLRPYFDSVITLDDCEPEEKRILNSIGRKINLSKPHPYSILRVVQEIGIPNPYCVYVGDVVDDMLAVQAAKKNLSILAVGFLAGHRDKRAGKISLIKSGADLVIEKPKQLLRLVS